jgi:hypothetical protein
LKNEIGNREDNCYLEKKAYFTERVEEEQTNGYASVFGQETLTKNFVCWLV